MQEHAVDIGTGTCTWMSAGTRKSTACTSTLWQYCLLDLRSSLHLSYYLPHASSVQPRVSGRLSARRLSNARRFRSKRTARRLSMQLRRTLRQLAVAAVLLYVAATGGELLAARLFDEHPSRAIPKPTPSLDAGIAPPAVSTAAAVLPKSTPSAERRVANVNPHCPAYAIPTTGHRPELTKLLEQLVHGARVKGSRVHLFVDMTALVADHKLLSSLQKSFGVHVHHRSKQVQDKQQATRPARPWPDASKKAEERAGAAQTSEIDMPKAVGLWYHYAFMLETMFGAGQNSANAQSKNEPPFGTEYVAILEDDLSVSVDIDEYVLLRHTHARHESY